jgi:hypothetical protein
MTVEEAKKDKATQTTEAMTTDPTEAEIDQLDGRELDAAVAREVMQWVRVEIRSTLISATEEWTGVDPLVDRMRIVPLYHQDINLAWQVVRALMQKGYRYVLRGNFEGDGKHSAAFDDQDWADSNPLFRSWGSDSLPTAICRAALKATRRKDHERRA